MRGSEVIRDLGSGTESEISNQKPALFPEINFNRYFYRYTPPRPLEEIESDIREIEKDIVRMLAEVTGSGTGQ